MTATPSRDLSLPATPAVTYREFLDSNVERAEWVRGEVIPMMSVSREHQLTGAFLISLLREFVTVHELGAVLYDPYQVEILPGISGRAPDIVFVATANLGRLQDDHLAGPPDLAIEIISPGTASIDRGDKFYEYEEGGLPEYWLVDPHRQSVDFYRRNERGIFRFVPLDDAGVYSTPVLPGLRLDPAWLWSRPSLLAIARDAGLLADA